MSGYAVRTAGAFDRSRGCFEGLVAGLAGADADGLTHVELEDRLAERGRELLWLMLQDHVDLRAAREERRQRVVGADGVVRSRVETGHARGLATVFGTVAVTRMAYRAPGVGNLCPADAVLNLPVEKHSHGLRRLVAVEAVRGSFDTALAAVDRSCGVRVPKRQAQRLAQAAAVDVEAFYAARRYEAAGDDQLLVMSYDGKGIVMIPSALRDATARAAARGEGKLRTRLSPGEKRGRKRMAELAVVYDATPVPRTPAEIITGDGGRRRRGPVAQAKWLTASVVDDIAPVITAGFDEACRRDPHQRRTWIALVDGNRTQIDAIQAEARRRQVSVHIVLDFVHVLEYVWKAAWAFFYTGDPAAEAWVGEQAVKILSGKAGQVAAGIRRWATRYRYNAKERAGADECAAYLTAKQPYLDYHTALAAGWPIATGVIEGACRHLVKDRMDITGARWGTRHRRSHPQTTRRNHQRRLRRLLGLPPAARTPTHTPNPIPATPRGLHPRRLTSTHSKRAAPVDLRRVGYGVSAAAITRVPGGADQICTFTPRQEPVSAFVLSCRG